jgi:hypothetical protein
VVINRISLHLPQFLYLFPKVLDSLFGGVKFLIVSNHLTTSTIPRFDLSRLICQYSSAACSPPMAAAHLIQNTLAPSTFSAAKWSKMIAASSLGSRQMYPS